MSTERLSYRFGGRKLTPAAAAAAVFVVVIIIIIIAFSDRA